MNPANVLARMLPTPVYNEVIKQADDFYDGKVSSVEAYTAIDRVALSAWHHFSGILNRTREEFDRHIDRRIDAEVDGWTREDA